MTTDYELAPSASMGDAVWSDFEAWAGALRPAGLEPRPDE